MTSPLSTSAPVNTNVGWAYTNAVDYKRQVAIAKILRKHNSIVDLSDPTARNNLAFDIVADLFYPLEDA